MSARAWYQLLAITDTTYQELTLEVLATFEFHRGMVSFHWASTIQFQVFETCQQISLMEFSIMLEFYDE